MRARRRLLPVIVLAGLLALPGCGSGEEASSGSSGAASTTAGGPVVVSAAASLNRAFTAYGRTLGATTPRLSFAGSDELAAQIRQGVEPDVFAAANTRLPEELFAEGLVERPVVFATNELVLAVPADGGAGVASVEDLTRDDVDIAIGAEGVPVGDYTRTVLGRLASEEARAVLANVRSNEPDVAGVVGKLTQGAVDAGFVYRSDVTGAGGRLRAIDLPAALRPTVEYGIALVDGAPDPAAGRAFIEGLRGGEGARLLRENGFGVPGT